MNVETIANSLLAYITDAGHPVDRHELPEYREDIAREVTRLLPFVADKIYTITLDTAACRDVYTAVLRRRYAAKPDALANLEMSYVNSILEADGLILRSRNGAALPAAWLVGLVCAMARQEQARANREDAAEMAAERAAERFAEAVMGGCVGVHLSHFLAA